MDFLNIHTCTYGQISNKSDIAVLIAISGFKESTLRNNLAIIGNHFCICIQSKLNIGNFTIVADMEYVVMLHCLFKINNNFLTLVYKRSRGSCDFYKFTGIDKLNVNGCLIDYHSVRCGNFLTLIFTEIKGFRGCCTIFACGNGIYNLSLCIANGPVKGDNVFKGNNFIYCTLQALDLINGLINTVFFGYRGEHFAGLCDGNSAFLCHIGFNHSYKVGRAVHLKGNGSAVKYITVAGILLNNFVITVRKSIRQHQFTAVVGIVNLYIHRNGIIDMLDNVFARIGVTNLKANTGGRNNLSGFFVLLNNFDFRLKCSVVNQITIGLAILIDVNVKGRHKLFAFKSFNLLYNIHAVRKIVGSFGKSVFIGCQQRSFGFSCIFIRTCALEINLKHSVFFGVFDLGRAIICVFNNCDFSADNSLIHIDILGIEFNGVFIGIGIHIVNRRI